MKNTTKSKGNENSPFAKKLDRLLNPLPDEGDSIKLTELGNILNISQQAVSKWASGENTPTIDNLIAIADYFGITIDELVTGAAYENKVLHNDTGLSNNALNILKKYHATYQEDTTRDDMRNILEFLNLIIEYETLLPRLANQSINYIIAAHNHVSDQKKACRESKNDVRDVFTPYIGEADLQSEKLDLLSVQLKNTFDDFVKCLIEDKKIRKRICKNCKTTDAICVTPYKAPPDHLE